MILEVGEAFIHAEVFHVAAATISSILKPVRRLARHCLVFVFMPVLNALSHRAYAQFLPDRYSGADVEIRRLRKLWDTGRLGNNGGDHARLFFLTASIQSLESARLPGAFAELGVFKGNSARIMHEMAPERDLFLFDTFEGLPEEHVTADPAQTRVGGFASSLSEVRRFVGEGPRIHYCQGIFPETAELVPEDVRFALVHLDCDLYVPTKAALEFFYPRMTPGGLLIVHDYHSGYWPGVTAAADEFLADKPEGLVYIPDKSGSAALVRQHDMNSKPT
ncbi:TylF/MycF/NovP-related O-methyltransferase [Thalassobaculum litoreum]|uniref:Macrocin-O-methyltransferase (TylF) n=1 Tax=Thalassobaculum litoreum DSM 18839 TaxID=1123362 RepID=A0A8G2BJZ6_9PROT|nr:TylF/MycF/NovP-related O-methyltransferase [Thalassobaculum litoreum]SDG14128.1 Macrocin-O-methyltransferase (TylF) [Thalassobaculum litoreum DSM 18839]